MTIRVLFVVIRVTGKSRPAPSATFMTTLRVLCVECGGHPPKLSYMIDSGSTPNESSIWTTAFDMGPGPHM